MIVMAVKTYLLFLLFLFMVGGVLGCNSVGEVVVTTPHSTGPPPTGTGAERPSVTAVQQTATDLLATVTPFPPETAPATASPTSTLTPTETEVAFEVGRELTIEYLRGLDITGSEITFERELPRAFNYHQHLVSYLSEGYQIYGLLTIPIGEPPEGGFKAVVFNHGYIPPAAYRTTERYTAYVDYLARSGFVVFKIDYRGHGQSEGEPSGTYFSPGYTLDAIAALKSLQTLDFVDSQGIGMWGHSMAGNLILRAMLIEPDIQAGVIWAGAVYSYDDFMKYAITDNTYRPPVTPETEETPNPRRGVQDIFETYGRPDTQTDYWQAVSLTGNIKFLNRPIQLHHAEDDPVVNLGYSFDLAAVLQDQGKAYEFYTYVGGGHNLVSPYFDQAMQRTVAFFRDNL
jgi:dipeptidyl aminopeptidase/acylaminoacyl peptidase